MGHQNSLPRFQAQDESLMPAAIVVVSEGSCNFPLSANLNVALALLESG